MPQNPPKKASKQRSIGSAMTLPFVLAILAIVAILGAVLSLSNSYTDDEAVSRQRNLVVHLIDDQRSTVRTQQEDMVIWDAAAAAVYAPKLDLEFVNDNLGAGATEFFGHDQVYLLNPKLEPIYSMRDGLMTPGPDYEKVRAVIEPEAQRLRDINWRGALDAFTKGRADSPPSVQDVVIVDNTPAVISLMPVASDKLDQGIAPGREIIHVSVQYLDDVIAHQFGELLLLQSGRFSTNPKLYGTETSVPVRNNAGEDITYFIWEPYLPSAGALKRSGPVILLALAVGGALISVLMLRLHRSTRDLEAGRSEAQRLAYHDALTGLGNRITFEKSMATAIESLKVRGADAVAFLMLDLDRFKQVNDTLGHEAGDELIREVAARLRPLVRSSDTIVRLGGDEFGIVMYGVTSSDDLAALSQRILAAIRAPFELKAGQAFVGVSIGIAVTKDPNADPVELTREADIALYEAKEGGRNQFRIFEEYMSEVVRSRQRLEADLRAALRTDDQLDVRFEPLVRQADGEVMGTAATITWHHPTRGNVPPSEFLPLAESCGLIEIIGEFVLHQACLAGAETPGKVVAVQVHPAQLRNPHFFDKVFSILDKTGHKPQDLEFEVDEKTLASGEENVQVALRKFRHAGVRIALSDFGTGFTSLRLLQKFQVDRIKMDRSFINELEQSPDPEAITHAVIWLARAIGVEVSADGVDTASKRDFLARMGCMSFQGALFTPEGQASALRNMAPKAGKTKPEDENLTDVELWGTHS